MFYRNERYKQAYQLRQEGLTFKEIGEALGGVSVERARQMVEAWKRYLRGPKPPEIWLEAERAGVGTRMINVLKAQKLTTKADIEKALRSGVRFPGAGEKTLDEVRSWLKIPKPESANQPPSEAAIKGAVTLLKRAGYKVTRK